MNTCVWLALLLVPAAALAQDCPSVSNLVTNCGLDSTVAGYTPQEPGDAIAHVSTVGATALGAMRVTDTVADGGTDAEAETCVNTSAGVYRLAASFKAGSAVSTSCFVGFDEHSQPNCSAANGNYVPGTPLAVNNQVFTRYQGTASIGAAVRSIELVILCDANGIATEFDVDDVAVVQLGLFANGFE